MNGFLWLLVRRESARTATDQSDCSNGFDAWYAVAIIVQTLVRCAMLHRSNQLTCTTTLRQSCQQTNKHIMHRLIPPKSALLQNHSRVVIAYADVNIIIIRTPSHPSSSLSLAIYHHNGQQHQERYITHYLPKRCLLKRSQRRQSVPSWRCNDHHRWMRSSSFSILQVRMLIRMWEIRNWIQIFPHRLHIEICNYANCCSSSSSSSTSYFLLAKRAFATNQQSTALRELWIMQSPQNIMSYKCAKFALAVVAAMIPFGWMVCARILYWMAWQYQNILQ